MTRVGHIEGLDPMVIIEIDDKTGKWIKFIRKNKGNKDSLTDCYKKAIDANEDLKPIEKTRLKQRQIE